MLKFAGSVELWHETGISVFEDAQASLLNGVQRHVGNPNFIGAEIVEYIN